MAVSTRGTTASKSRRRGSAARSGAAKQNGAGRPRAHKWVYRVDEGSAEMTRAGLLVPPGFTITTEACNAFYARGGKFPEGLWEQVEKSLRVVEKTTGKGFGDPRNPLLVSVRSGAKFSMPGMMDTVLNLGLNAKTLEGLA